MARNCPRLVIAGLSGDTGKTVASLSLLTALRRRGRSLSVFKKGPDYIDAAWLSWAAGIPCRNLDTFMVDPERVRSSFVGAATDSDLAVIEGNRGLFDGKDAAGTHSTASLARLLRAPVVLVVNATKTTRTVAAMVRGCQVMDPDLNLAGVILNQVSGERHRRVITEAVAQNCGLPVLGCIPRLGRRSSLIPGRHLGLVTPAEFGDNTDLADRLAEIGEEYLEIDRLIAIAGSAPYVEEPSSVETPDVSETVRVGYFHDSAFTFYYPENLEALRAAGAELVPVSSIDEKELPSLDGLYIGGGFPETHAERLSQNLSLRQSVGRAVERGLPVYAECGGLIFLSRSLRCGDKSYDMAGVFDVDLAMQTKPVGHGYAELTVDRDNPFFEAGYVLRGHEFHYSGPVEALNDSDGCLRVGTGVGLGNGRDGLVYKNCMAAYTHIHALGADAWAEALVRRARRFCEQTGENEKRASGAKEKVMAEPPGARLSPQVSGW